MQIAATDRIEKSVEIKASPARVWRALTDHREFGAWFRVNMEGPFEPGRSVKGRSTHPGYEHVVLEMVDVVLRPEEYFSFRWRPYALDPAVDYSKEPRTLVEFRLEPAAVGTLLRVTESGFDGIPAWRRDEAFRMNSEGWDEEMGNIKVYVERER